MAYGHHSMPTHESRVFHLALLAGAPAVAAMLLILWIGDHTPKVQWTVTVVVILTWLGVALTLQDRVVRPLQTISNMLAALREGDYSIRARGAGPDDALGLALLEVNALSETLRGQRLGALEASALLRTVMSEIDVAVFTFDHARKLQLVNRAGERLLARPAERLLGKDSAELGLDGCLEGETPRVIEAAFPLSIGRWEVRRDTFRWGGTVHQLVVLTDLSRTLQAEERQAWQRLVRVLSHEINNSLAPIKSIAGSLDAILSRRPRSPDFDHDLRQGLTVIANRSESLGRFMASYARLARLPHPKMGPVDVAAWVHRVASLERRTSVAVQAGPTLTIQADGDQLDQLLINLVGNAVDSVQETGGAVSVGWEREEMWLEVAVEDEGTGLADTANLFVPFYTTKPGGSGIGLALSRQIAESHGGSLRLENRADTRGCRALLRLPLGVAAGVAAPPN